jgi:hypothetical protein
VGLVFELSFALAKQALPGPFCSGYFGDGNLLNFLPWLALNYDPPDFSHPSN